ncbi:MAG: hypothetical protein ACPKOI_06110 [Pleomorphochaeta sp.]|jgi:hypothetical protein
MKKGSIVSLVFSCLFFVLGVSLVLASFRQALTPVSIQHYAEGFTMRLSINNLNLAISSISLMFLVLGSSLVISSILLLMLSCYLHVSSTKLMHSVNRVTTKEAKVITEKPKKKKKEEAPKKEIIEEQIEKVDDAEELSEEDSDEDNK